MRGGETSHFLSCMSRVETTSSEAASLSMFDILEHRQLQSDRRLIYKSVAIVRDARDVIDLSAEQIRSGLDVAQTGVSRMIMLG